MEYTESCLESVLLHTDYENYDVILADNYSMSDKIRQLAKNNANRTIKNITGVSPYGIALHQAEKSDIVFLSSDILITQKDWLYRLNETAYHEDKIGIVGCRLISKDNRLFHAGTYIYPETFDVRQVGENQKNINQYSDSQTVQGVIFHCAYVKRFVLETLEGCNEALVPALKEMDYCLKAEKAGCRCVCCGEVTLACRQNISEEKSKESYNIVSDSQKRFEKIWGAELANRYTRKMAWHSLTNFPSGYAVSAKNFMLTLDKLGVDIRYKYVYGKGTPGPIEEPPGSNNYVIDLIHNREFRTDIPQVVYGQGDVFRKNTGSYKIGYTMFEATGIPEEWVKQANEMDEIWTPSEFNVETFRSSGVKTPIYVMPLGFDPSFFNTRIKSYKRHKRYTFLSVFEWGERKAPEILLRAYSKAFQKTDDVILICKVFNNDRNINLHRQFAALNLPMDGPEIAVLYNYNIPDYQMATLYRSADCFVLPTRGEGWGMPMLEAMACGLPVIATGWGAQTEFFNNENGYVLDIKGLVDAKSKYSYYDGFQWADPDEEQLVELMRYIYRHQEEAAAKGLQASEEVTGKWTWNQAAQRMIKRLDAIS